MKRYNMVLVDLLFIVLFTVSCTSRQAPQPAQTESFQSPVQGEQKAMKETWQERWEKTLQEARREGRVVVYGGSTAAALKLKAAEPFKKKFGIELESLTMSGSEIRAKLRGERNAGLFMTDVYASGITGIYDILKPMGAAEPLEPTLMLPEIRDQNVWFGGKLPWGDEEKRAFYWGGYPDPSVAINTSIIQPSEIKSYYDLLDPRWSGKIVLNDPMVGSGSAFYSFTAMLFNKIVDQDFFNQLVKNQRVTMVRDQQLQITWLARGRFPVAFWASTGRFEEYQKAGAPMAWLVTKEGLHLSAGGTGIALLNRAPHPNAAIIFINWLLSKEGQMLIQNSTGKHSMRTDIPSDQIDPSHVRQAGVKYFLDPYNNEKFALQEADKYQELSKQIFSPLSGR